ncbi:disease resistance protein RGA5-like [Triticum urartu]|uniref:disease resistance protein RGA5-like n=1 Tax=Triticum urartu TaxID=4572 RepID=UPI002042CDDB|nr:disease resistance protein RGA5-like [Triticum urartu]XP_048552266.1 disease resistance protein RGA5-like [Triticum urartu]
MLDLRNTNLHELPAAILSLGNLVHLFTGSNVKYLDGIGKMQSLQTLKQIDIFLQSSNFFQELCQLKNLRKLRLKLGDDPTEVNKECMKVIASTIYELSTLSLDSLKIGSEDGIENDYSLDDSFLLEQWCPAPRSLRELIISQTILRIPDWVGSFINLQRLILIVKSDKQEDLYALGGLPTLSFLILCVKGEAESIGRLTVSGTSVFACLKVLFFYTDEHRMELVFVEGSMPKLEFLFISFSAAKTETLSYGVFISVLKTSPALGPFIVHFMALPRALIGLLRSQRLP